VVPAAVAGAVEGFPTTAAARRKAATEAAPPAAGAPADKNGKRERGRTTER